ncbi:MAG: hypothetical protein OIN85_05290, partial [Candidatus Methanoperedens sp.]|nr:hypothetical protein [Candidatus Methanoperedens sp.]
FYITLLLFVILAFISFWGITFPVFIQLTQGLKVNVASDTKNFFNIWSYPFTIILLLALGFCLSYKESDKKNQIQNLAAVAAISVIAMFLRTGNFYVLDHTSPFYVREPTLYKLIGSISLISIFPSLIYAAWAIVDRLREYLLIKSLRPRIKGIGIAAVHFGMVFIIFGAIISSTFTSTIDNINIPLTSKGELVDIGNGYGVKFIDLSTSSLTGNTQSSSGTPIADILNNPSSFEGTSVKISGQITNISSLEGHGTLVELTDNSGSMLAVFPGNITETIGAGLTVTGNIMTGFAQPVLSVVDSGGPDTSNRYNVQNVKLEVYQNERLIGSGVAEYLSGNGGSGTFPMVDRSITGTDVYVIFQGQSGGYIPLTLKIIPAVNFAWAGILLFAFGIILIMGTKSKTG